MVGVCELVGVGHPDKVADYVADYLLDYLIMVNPQSRAAFEVLVTGNEVYVGGEYYCPNPGASTRNIKIKTREALVNILSRQDLEDLNITVSLYPQSPEIVENCLKGSEMRFPDQGVVYGYATSESPTLMPFSYYIARKIYCVLDIETQADEKLGRDFKLLVTTQNNMVKSVCCSMSHRSSKSLPELRKQIGDVIFNIISNENLAPGIDISVNPGGSFMVSGLCADSGTTNRKIMGDTYGCDVEHGGGGLSGKDLTKPDRLMAYWARYIAKNAVASGWCSFCKIKLVYRYGDTHCSEFEVMSDSKHPSFPNVIRKLFSHSYSEVYNIFKKHTWFSSFARDGHFGVADHGDDLIFEPWERLNSAEKIKEAMQKRWEILPTLEITF